MFVPLPLLILGGLAFLVLLVMAFRPRGPSDDLLAAPRSLSPRVAFQVGHPLELMSETREQVEALLADGYVMGAIKLVCETTGLGLKDAKDAVDEMRRSVLPQR